MFRRFSSTTKSLNKSVGFIGLGQMGYPMASNLLKGLKPTEFWINDHSSQATENFRKEHPQSKIAKSPREIAENCSVVVTMLPASAHVKSVYLEENGLLEGLQSESLVIDSSTIDPSTTKEVFAVLSGRKISMIDAPVSGGTNGAKSGTLTFMVGAENENVFEKAKATLKHMGKNINYCGKPGNGQVAKICNNMLLGISMLAAAETMNLGVQMGMDPKLLSSIVNTSSGRCWSTEVYNPCPGVMENVPASREYTGGFGMPLMAKDMGLAVNAANEAKSTVILATLAHQVYSRLIKEPAYKTKDFSAVYKWLENKS